MAKNIADYVLNNSCSAFVFISKRELTFTSVVSLSVTFVRPTQAIEIFGNVSTPFGTLAIC